MTTCDKRLRFQEALNILRNAVVDICNICDDIEINNMLTFDDPKEIDMEVLFKLAKAGLSVGKAMDMFVKDKEKP